MGSDTGRFPLIEIQRGWYFFPIFFEQLHGAVFADYVRPLVSGSTDQLAIGGEIRLDGSVGNLLRSTLRLSFAVEIAPERTRRFLIQIGETF